MASFDLADLVPDSAASGDVSAALGGTATMGDAAGSAVGGVAPAAGDSSNPLLATLGAAGDAGGMFQALSGMQADMHDTASDVLTNVR